MYIARQPIFDRTKEVFGYELLFRESDKVASYSGKSAESSTAVVLGGLFELGVAKIVGKKKAFVNFSYSSLMSDSILLIDPYTLVIEVLEDVKVDNRLVNRLYDLKKKGYKIALDDFAENIESYQVVPLANIIKYDIMLTPLDAIKNDVKYALKQKKVLLAEKIETEEDFNKAKMMGFHLFQGYFFSKPSIVGSMKGKKKSMDAYQRVLAELNSEEPSFQTLTEIVETDVNLAYRLLQIMSRRDDEASKKSIKTALMNMGLDELERWVHVMMLQDFSTNKPRELMKTSLIRSKFGELIAMNSAKFRKRRSEVSLMCLFSVLDAMLDTSMENALEGIELTADTKEALLNDSGSLQPIIALAKSFEQGLWHDIKELTETIGISDTKLSTWFIDSIHWAEKIIDTYYGTL